MLKDIFKKQWECLGCEGEFKGSDYDLKVCPTCMKYERHTIGKDEYKLRAEFVKLENDAASWNNQRTQSLLQVGIAMTTPVLPLEESDKLFCGKCKSPIDESDFRCSQCGAPIQWFAADSLSTASKELLELVKSKGILVETMEKGTPFASVIRYEYKTDLGAVAVENALGNVSNVYLVYEDYDGSIKYYDYPQHANQS